MSATNSSVGLGASGPSPPSSWPDDRLARGIFVQRIAIEQIAEVLRRGVFAKLVGHIIPTITNSDPSTSARHRTITSGSVKRAEMMDDNVPGFWRKPHQIKVSLV